ncbi:MULTISPECIES: LTA synthase family protein [unclassified Rhodanobacter]|uniref:LTA synthase family protein n=1 Tax=unclassified Rhodanobacter TaxID=2621553 RepID=UPI001BE0BD26|nr:MULTISPECIES: LTA synthase family protein [unclassified Rhodanobacter]MBT2145403.1 LTA synthase family protein [Rhodanobacter sp. LX-99]MBT2149448.1 LTA synthase family protein [Rhodanobacter sp. LX-100]
MRQLTWRFLLLTFVFLTLSRFALCLWLWPRVQPTDGLWPVLFGGWRIDLCLLAMVCAWPALLSPWLGHRRWPTRITAWWYRSWWLLFVLLEVSTPQFILEYDTRPNRLYVEYLDSPHEVSAMLWHGYKGVLLAGLVALALLGWLGFRLLRTRRADARMRFWLRPLVTAAAFAVLFLAARGTLDHRPLNASVVAFSDDSMVNSLPLNSLYNVINAIRGMSNERSAAAIYGPMPEQEMQRLVRQAAGLDGSMPDPRYPSMHHQQAAAKPAKPLSLVIILEESLGAQYIGTLGGDKLSPQFDALAKEGWLLARTYATGTRSVRGLEAVNTGFLPTPAEAVLKLPRSQHGFFTLAGLLGEFGYRSRFIYGGEAHFDNMKSFFLGNGFDEVVDQPKFEVKPTFVGSWGASDEDMFNELHHRLMQDGDKRQFTLAFSVSNHTPWEYPAGRIRASTPAASVQNTARYADWAIGQFFARAKRSPYWDHTVFLVVADHDSRVFGASLVPVRHFHIPALILGAGVPAQRDEHIVSQIDLAPTLLSLIGISSVHPMLGADLTVHYPDRAIMQYGDNYGYLKRDQLLVLQPGQPAEQFHYQADGETLTPVPVDPALDRLALAHALWPSWAYFNQRYVLPPGAMQPVPAPAANMPGPAEPAPCCVTRQL